MTSSARLRAAAVLAALAVALVGLSAPTEAAPVVQPGHEVGPTTFTEPGPYGVGERTLKLKSGVRVEVWYPARKAATAGRPEATYDVVDWLPEILKMGLPDGVAVTYPSGGVRGVPVARSKFPLILFSHGYAGFRTQSSFLTSWLASWGFVVAAPDHPSRNLTAVLQGTAAGLTTDAQDLRQTITLMKSKSSIKGSWLRGHVDLTRIGALGHSAGGRAVENLATVDKRVDTFIGMAGASTGALGDGSDVPQQPGLLITGTADEIVGLDRMEAAYAAMNGPKRFVLIENAGHLAFSDLCEVGAGDGGLLAIAEIFHIQISDSLRRLATDGCVAPKLEPTLAWPAIEQTVVAYFRYQLGVDEDEAGLAGLADAFPGIVSDSRSDQ